MKTSDDCYRTLCSAFNLSERWIKEQSNIDIVDKQVEEAEEKNPGFFVGSELQFNDNFLPKSFI